MLEVAERIKWESNGLLTGRGVWDCRSVAHRCVLWSTDKGTVQKVIVLPRDDLQTEELVLEEVEVFKVSFYLLLFSITLSFYFTLFTFFALPSLFCVLLPFSNLLIPLYIHFHMLKKSKSKSLYTHNKFFSPSRSLLRLQQ